jgi:hypothetical protein
MGKDRIRKAKLQKALALKAEERQFVEVKSKPVTF